MWLLSRAVGSIIFLGGYVCGAVNFTNELQEERRKHIWWIVIDERIYFAQESFAIRLWRGGDAFLLLQLLTLEAETEGFVLFSSVKLFLHHLLQKFLKCMWTEAWKGTDFFVILVLADSSSKWLCCCLTESNVWLVGPNPEVLCRWIKKSMHWLIS